MHSIAFRLRAYNSTGARPQTARARISNPVSWRTVSSHSSHHPQEVLLAQFSLYVHKGGLKPDSLHYNSTSVSINVVLQHV